MTTFNRPALLPVLFFALATYPLHSEKIPFTIANATTFDGAIQDTISTSCERLSIRGKLKSAVPWTGENPASNVELSSWGIAITPIPKFSLVAGAIAYAETPYRLAHPHSDTGMAVLRQAPCDYGQTLSLGSSANTGFVGMEITTDLLKAVTFGSPSHFDTQPAWFQLTTASRRTVASRFNYAITAFAGISRLFPAESQSWYMTEDLRASEPICIPGLEFLAAHGPLSARALASANLSSIAKTALYIEGTAAIKLKWIAGAVGFSAQTEGYVDLDGDSGKVLDRCFISTTLVSARFGRTRTLITAGGTLAMERSRSGTFPEGILKTISGGGALDVENKFIHSQSRVTAETESVRMAEHITFPYLFTPKLRFEISGKTTLNRKQPIAAAWKDSEAMARVSVADIGPFSAECDFSTGKSTQAKPTTFGGKVKLSANARTAHATWEMFASVAKKIDAKRPTISAGITAHVR